jgi:REP-associated tyrosine transposase
MPRFRRCVVPGYPHHVYQRGVRKEPLFHEDRDFFVYVRVLREGCLKHTVSIRTYAFMTNHVHLIAVPGSEDSFSRALHDAHTRYSTYFNSKYGFKGHAWEGRPQMCVTDESHMWNAIRYVERNPVRAGMVERAEHYSWSSAAAHCGLRDDILLDKDFPPPGVIENWAEWLQVDHSEHERRQIRQHTFSGRPWGTPEFLLQLEALTKRPLRPRKSGRPKGKDRGDRTLPFEELKK